ncbi:MAG: phage tail protein [Plesiomonas sp.]
MSTMSYETNWAYQAELDAVNDILAAIGESPVSTLEGDINADVVNARRILAKINRTEQAKGWTFNIDETAQLQPDVYSQLIPYMPNYLRITSTGGTPYVNRGGFVYDRLNKTDRFTTAVECQLVTLMTYDEMPEVFKQYIVTKAAKEFNIRFYGSPDIDTVLGNDLIDLLQAINEYELDYGGFNAFNNDPFISQAIQR